jgi:hypothetical protein
MTVTNHSDYETTETETYLPPKVYAAIAAVSAALAEKGVGKGRKNLQQGYAFRGIDDMYNALAPELSKAGLCILPRCLEREVVERRSQKDQALFYVTVTMEFCFVAAADGSTHVVGPMYGEAMDSGDKATNKAMSAAYKYAVMQAFAIPVEGQSLDSEKDTHEVRPANADRPNTATQVAVDAFQMLPEAQQLFLRDQAMEIMARFQRKEDMAAWIDAQHYDTEEKLGLWSLLPSDCRAEIKRQAAALKAAHLAEQA